MVKVSGRSDEWCGNGLVFATKQEAESNAHDLMMRWMLVTDSRADETDSLVNYKWAGGRLIAVEAKTIMKSILILAFSAVTLLALAPSNADAQYTNNRPLVNNYNSQRLVTPTRPDAYNSSPASEALRQQLQTQELDSANQRVREQVQDMLRQMQR